MRVLVVHGLRNDSRLTNFHHALCFARHLRGHDVVYVNAFGNVDSELRGSDFDLVIATYEVLAQRNTPYWRYLEERLMALFARAEIRVVMPQDDYSSCALLDDFVMKTKTQFVFTPIRRDLAALYPRSTAAGVRFYEALTGYWESATSIQFLNLCRPFGDRRIDLGQRVRHLPPQFGLAAAKKGQLALNFAEQCATAGFNCDVSTRDEDVLVGTKWWEFLGDIRFTVGRLGGASVGDPFGKLAEQAYRLQARKPGITRDELARRIRVSTAPTGDFSAISPRLFEAAAMGVCQILENDEYFPDFIPWKHFIPLDPDLANASEVFAAMRDHDLCISIIKNAQEFLIDSNSYSYQKFVQDLAHETLGVAIDHTSEVTLTDHDSCLFSEVDRVVKKPPVSARSNARHPFRARARGNSDVWITKYRQHDLLAESFFLPWISATEALSRS